MNAISFGISVGDLSDEQFALEETAKSKERRKICRRRNVALMRSKRING